MPVQFDNQTATLSGTVTVEEAETLSNWLKENSRDGAHPQVAMASCEHVHAAVLQTLLALQPVVESAPANPHLHSVLKVLPARERVSA